MRRCMYTPWHVAGAEEWMFQLVSLILFLAYPRSLDKISCIPVRLELAARPKRLPKLLNL